MFYRVQQFLKALIPRVEPAEITWALDNLPPEARSLFLKQSKAERRHALDVAQDLSAHQNSLSPTDYQNLIAAALLHDCGKTEVRNRLWHRVFIVFMQQLPPSAWSRLENSGAFLAAPLRTASLHALWGGDLAQSAGLNPTVCLLITEHHQPHSKLGHLLARSDNRH